MRTIALTVLAVVPVLVASIPCSAGEWTLRLEPTLMDAYGHDQHVLDVHETAASSTTTAGVNLDTENGLAWRSELRFSGEVWAFGADVTVFYTDQGTADRSGSGGGTVDQVAFEVAGRSFASSGPDEVLFYGVLEDTSLQTWTVDLYALRTLAGGADSGLHLQLGVRSADFDNDYRAVVGVEGVGGRRLDASSNYDRMMGPLVGVIGQVRRGRCALEGSVSQSVLLGSVELSSTARDFTGPLSAAFPVEAELPTTYASHRFRTVEDVAIPVTDLRVRWTYRVAGWLALGVGVNSSAWWDVPVPPGVIPGDGGQERLHEATIVFLGLSAVVEVRF